MMFYLSLLMVLTSVADKVHTACITQSVLGYAKGYGTVTKGAESTIRTLTCFALGKGGIVGEAFFFERTLEGRRFGVASACG